MDYFESLANYSVTKNPYETYEDFKDEWEYVAYLFWFYKNLHGKNFDLPINYYGTFVVKLLNAFGENTKKEKCKSLENDLMKLVSNSFTMPDQDVSLPDIGYLFNVLDFKVLTENSTNLRGTSPPSLTNMKKSFSHCFKEVAKVNIEVFEEFFDQELVNPSYTKQSPCFDQIDHDHPCHDYCKWHKKFIDDIGLEEFLTIMKFAIPQRKIMMEPMSKEIEMAEKLFGKEKVEKDSDTRISPVSPFVFCHRVNQGYTGDDIGMIAKVCNDFFPTISDVGIVYSKNMDMKEIMKVEHPYNLLFETNEQKANGPIEGGTLWSKTTLVIFTDSYTDFSQSYKREPYSELNKIQFQIHQSKDLAKMLTGTDFDENSVMIELESRHEYYIDVIPHGQKSTENFKTLSKTQRKCLLEQVVAEDSIFNVYTKNNCKYECHVKLAQEKCGCIPWDFILGNKEEECDVFGRTCFSNYLKLVSQSPNDKCTHCLNECDYIVFDKKIIKKSTLDTGT